MHDSGSDFNAILFAVMVIYANFVLNSCASIIKVFIYDFCTYTVKCFLCWAMV